MPRRPSYVYFVQQGRDGPIKIGIADDPDLRLGQLQCGNPRLLYIRATEPGGVRLERALHKQFAHARMQGEWFEPSDDLLKRIPWGQRPDHEDRDRRLIQRRLQERAETDKGLYDRMAAFEGEFRDAHGRRKRTPQHLTL
jgi:hypothetical protein